MKHLFSLLFLVALLTSCGHRKDAKSFEKLLEAETGQQHSIEKLRTVKGDYVVYKNEATGEYVAYNMGKFDRDTMISFSQFSELAVEGTDIVRNLDRESVWVSSGYWSDIYRTEYYYYDVYDEDCDCYYTESDTYEVWVGEEWIDTSRYVTYFYGGGFTFDNTTTASRDLELMAALKEEVAEKFVAHSLTSKFSLSSNRAAEMAKLVTRYQKLENVRELTNSEKDEFALDALGVSFNSIESALKKKASGDNGSYQDLLKKAAQVNNTSPEQIGSFFDEFVGEGL